MFACKRWTKSFVLPMALLLGGCTMFQQSDDVTLIREPGQRQYGPPIPVSVSSQQFWEYAVLSSNVYSGEWKLIEEEKATAANQLKNIPPPAAKPDIKKCLSSPRGSLPIDGWQVWNNFPSLKLRENAETLGLYVQVFEKNTVSPPLIAVVFRGTDGSSDWSSNLRWFARFIPGHKDQYTLVSESLGFEFVDELAKRIHAGEAAVSKATVVSTGHSLGGGLAQHFAYSLPAALKDGVQVPRVSHVYAFDPSPVTGWYSVSRALRGQNAAGLEIDRIFEHGEGLAYIRLLQSYVLPPSAASPAIREVRYNFIRSANIFKSHSMLQLACHLSVAADKSHD